MDEPSTAHSPPRSGPGPLQRTAVVCGQLLITAAAVWVLGRVLATLTVVVIPLAIALLLAALFTPAVSWLARRGLPRALAATMVLLGGLAAVGGLLWFVVRAVATGLPDLRTRLAESYAELRRWLTGPVGLSGAELDKLIAQAKDWLSRNQQELVSGAWGAFSTAGALLAGLALVVFLLIFFVYDGPRMWNSLVRPLPQPISDRIRRAGAQAFHDLSAFMRAIIAVAAIDAVGIGLGLWITGVPLVIPLAALVFLGAFVPLIGAFVTGLLAVLVALVTMGPVIALIVAAIVIVVQQLEGNVFEPLITGNVVKLHPVAVILAVAVGVSQAGIIGALLAVPVLTTVRAVARSLLEQRGTG